MSTVRRRAQRAFGWLALLVGLFAGPPVLASCGGDDEAAQVPDAGPSTRAPGFLQIYEEILVPSCNGAACHGGPRGIAGLSFAQPDVAYRALVGQEAVSSPARGQGLLRVSPGDAENSFLMRKVEGTTEELAGQGFGAPMPLGGIRALGPTSLAAIRDWIDDGAPWDGLDFEPDYREPEQNYVRCEGETESELQSCFGEPRDPSRWMRIFSPPILVPAGSEVLFCSYLPEIVEEPLMFRATEGQQMLGGHHIALFFAANPSEDHTPHPCTDEEMVNFQFSAGAGGAGGQDTRMPDGVALRIEAGRQLVLQSHYLNPTEEDRWVMDAVDIELTDEVRSPTIVDSFAMLNSGFSIPPRSGEYERVTECRVDVPMSVYLLLGHTHDYGTLFKMERLPSGAAEGETEVLYEATDGPLLRANPEILTYVTPLRFEEGDRLRMTCRWENTTDHPLGWPEEMCVGLMYYAPGRGWLTCDEDDGAPRGDDPSVTACRMAGDEGNDVGVGRYCTESGGECRGNGDATFCLTPHDARHNYCSRILCTRDEECGDGARCAMESAGSACLLTACE